MSTKTRQPHNLSALAAGCASIQVQFEYRRFGGVNSREDVCHVACQFNVLGLQEWLNPRTWIILVAFLVRTHKIGYMSDMRTYLNLRLYGRATKPIQHALSSACAEIVPFFSRNRVPHS